MSDEENSLTQRDNFVPQRPRNYEKSIKRSQTELLKSDKSTQAGVTYVSKLIEEFDDITPIRPEEQINQHSFDLSSIFDEEKEPQFDRANHIDANLMDKISELQNYAKDLQREILDQEKVIELQQQQLKVLKSTLSESEGKYHKVHYTIRGEDPTANVGHIKEVMLRLFKQNKDVENLIAITSSMLQIPDTDARKGKHLKTPSGSRGIMKLFKR